MVYINNLINSRTIYIDQLSLTAIFNYLNRILNINCTIIILHILLSILLINCIDSMQLSHNFEPLFVNLINRNLY